MSEEEKKAVEGLKDYVARIKKFHFEQTQGFKWVDITLNLLENQQKELNNLKEIEKSHKEENGKLRVELEQEKEKTPETLRKQLELYQDRLYEEQEKNKELEKEKQERFEVTMQLIGSNYISKDKIRQKIEENKKLLDECDNGDIRKILHDEIRILKEMLEEK